MTFKKLVASLKGGSGSGNFGHSGRPGKKGGSAPGGGYSTGPIAKPVVEVKYNIKDEVAIKNEVGKPNRQVWVSNEFSEPVGAVYDMSGATSTLVATVEPYAWGKFQDKYRKTGQLSMRQEGFSSVFEWNG